MPQVASVRLRYASQDYWFDPAGLEIKQGDHVLVETSRGREIGLCTHDIEEVPIEELSKPLKPVVRLATDEDLEKCDELAQRGIDALATFRALIEKHELDMSPAAVEFMFDEEHATFYFTSEERIDFRSLVRDLASEFHIRIDMRQIGVRDEARMLGGLGHCGEELCCTRLGGEFKPVSIRMAKEQDLPLNPTKISGLCGRLMCCLRYEFEAYKDFKSRAPKKNGIIDTPIGLGKVVEFDTPRETVRVRMEDGSSVVLPVSALDTGDKVAKEGERIRPCHISQENFERVIEELQNDKSLAMMGDKLFSDDPDLADTTAQAGSVERVQRRRRSKQSGSGRTQSSERKPRRRSKEAEPPARDERKRRRSVSATDGKTIERNSSSSERSSRDDRSASRSQDDGRTRRRRRSNGSGDGERSQRSGDSSRKRDSQSSSKQRQGKPRPGQHSSTVSGDNAGSGNDADSNSSNNKRRRRKRGGRKHKPAGQAGGQGSSDASN